MAISRSQHTWGSQKYTEMKYHKSCEKRKVIVIFFSFIITLSTAHFSKKNILHVISFFSLPFRYLIAWKESKNNFSWKIHHPSTCTNVDKLFFIFFLNWNINFFFVYLRRRIKTCFEVMKGLHASSSLPCIIIMKLNHNNNPPNHNFPMMHVQQFRLTSEQQKNKSLN